MLQNDTGVILDAWVNLFNSKNPFCAETEAATQALKIAEELTFGGSVARGTCLQHYYGFTWALTV